MIDFPDYKKATNAAYELLSNYHGKMPVIDVFLLIHLLPYEKKAKIYTYSEYSNRLGCSFEFFLKNYASSEHGFTIKKARENKHIICYNERKDEKTIRFTVAHELGHIVLNHNCDNSVANQEANCFARNLLCPIPIADDFHVITEKDYVDCFFISEPMAAATINLRRSDKYYITKENYNNFRDIAYSYFSGYSLAELYGY